MKIEIQPIDMVPVKYTIWNEEGTAQAGYAMVTGVKKVPNNKYEETIRECWLWHIYIDHKYRRKGYAKKLLETIKAHHDVVITDTTTESGRSLLIRNGFNQNGNMWVWQNGSKTFEETHVKIKPTQHMVNVLQLCVQWYSISGNECGGKLHVVLDDDNSNDDWIEKFLEKSETSLERDILNGLKVIPEEDRIWVTGNIHNRLNSEEPTDYYKEI